MKNMRFSLSLFVCAALLFSACMKEEKPYALPPVPGQEGDFKVQHGQVNMGENYETQVYYSFDKGIVRYGGYQDWDISFTTSEVPELWMNGGKGVLLYPTGKKDYATVLSSEAVTLSNRVYDNPNGLEGESGLGILSAAEHVGEVFIADIGDGFYYKIQLKEIASSAYVFKAGPLESTLGQEYTLDKDEEYNFVFFSFEKGVVKVEPPKTDWDFIITRYRHVYYGHNSDGSDELYPVNGLLTNPYKTSSGKDTVRYDFYEFSTEQAATYTLYPARDVIGFDWKTVNINTSQYKVHDWKIFLIKDQHERLWKLRFVDFYDENNKKGSPKFEFQRLQ
jgi:hypothetical protein